MSSAATFLIASSGRWDSMHGVRIFGRYDISFYLSLPVGTSRLSLMVHASHVFLFISYLMKKERGPGSILHGYRVGDN
jgi:hypothetical protein